MEILRAGVQRESLIALARWRSHMSKIEAMIDKDGLPKMPFRLNRRQIITGMAALGAVAGGRNAFAQAPKRIPIPEGEFVPLPIAIPNFVAGPAAGAGGGVRGGGGSGHNFQRPPAAAAAE